MKLRTWTIGTAVVVATLVIGGLAWAVGTGDTVWAAETRLAEGLQGPGVQADDQEVARPPRRLQGNVARGTVTEVGEDEILLETAGEETVHLLITDRTRAWHPGEPVTTTVELQTGDPVLAFGQPVEAESGERTLSARLVVIASDEDLPKVLIQGEVVAITRQTIVARTGRGERAITIVPRTHLGSAEGELDSLRGIHPGEQIIALGQPTDYGQWIAGAILVSGPQPLARLGLRGKVIEVDAKDGTLTVKTDNRGQITVATDDATRYRIADVEEPGFDDIQVGDRIVALGRFEEKTRTTFLARGIGVIVPPAERKP